MCNAKLMPDKILCRQGCGACCIAPSISSAIPGMPSGKAAGVRCVQLTADNQCLLFGKPSRPLVCTRFSATLELCGTHFDAAMHNLTVLERRTSGSKQ